MTVWTDDRDRRLRPPPYQIHLVGTRWHVTRPLSTMDHAFDRQDEAEAFVLSDSSGTATFVELFAGTTYMIKQLRPPSRS
jgi:hypothetical protein